MKKLTTLIIASILVCSVNMGLRGTIASPNSDKDNELVVLSTPDLYNLTNQLSREYCKTNPGLTIKVVQVNNAEIPEIFNAGSNIGFISTEYFNKNNSSALWQIVIGRDVIVPIVNSNNPYSEEMSRKGITRQEFAQLFINKEEMNWRNMVNSSANQPINLYTINDPSINSVVAKFLEIEQGKIQEIVLENKEALLSAIQNDPYSLGFCKFTDILNSKDQSLLTNIKIVPIDKNENGKIDYYEDIYDNLSDFTRGVWIGKYPKEMVSDIYTAASYKPTNNITVNFLKWVITDGQEYLVQNGYTDLAFGEKQMKLDKLRNDIIYTDNGTDRFASLKIILIIVVGVIIISFTLGGLIRMQHRKDVLKSKSSSLAAFNENSVKIPGGLYFDKSHTWSFMEKDGLVKIGIDDFLQHATGPLTRTIIKNPGDKIKKGEQIITLVQEGKQLNVYAPISGTIKDINEILITEPSMINTSPYDEGWVYVIEPSNWVREVEFLKMAGSYKQWILNEFLHLKDFIANALKSHSLANNAQLVLQEGGELQDNLLQNLGPQVWEDFQKHFIDTYQLR